MKLLVSVVVIAVTVCVGVFASSQQLPWGFSVQDAQRVTRLSSSLSPVPYKPGLSPNIFTGNGITEGSGVRDSNGRVISTFGFYGWTDGTTVRVAVLSRVPVQGAENRFYSMVGDSNPSGVRFEELATYTLVAGKPTTIVEMKALGLEPMTLTLGVGSPPWSRGR